MQLINILFAALLAVASTNAAALPEKPFGTIGNCDHHGQGCHAKRDPAAVAEAIAEAGESRVSV